MFICYMRVGLVALGEIPLFTTTEGPSVPMRHSPSPSNRDLEGLLFIPLLEVNGVIFVALLFKATSSGRFVFVLFMGSLFQAMENTKQWVVI